MIEDSAEEFLMALSGEGGFGLPSPRRHNVGAPPAPVTTTPWTENAPTTQAMMTVPPQRSREAILSSGEGASFDVATHNSKEGVNGGKKRHRQHLQYGTTMTIHDDGNDAEAGGSGMKRSSIATRSDKCQARPPTDHFKRLIEEACPNHAYPIRHKLKDCVTMRNFMTSRSLTWGTELDEGPNGTDIMPFPRENAIWTVYGGRPHWGTPHV
jgi:hypothetical protein